MSIQPGELNQQIVIERKVRTASKMGGFDTEWIFLKKVWAKVRAERNSEGEDGERTISSQKYTVIIWNDQSIGAADRIIWNESYLNIVAPRHSGAESLFLFIDCETGTAQ